MKITRRQLRRIIKEAVEETGAEYLAKGADPEAVRRSLESHYYKDADPSQSVRRHMPFSMSANAVMDALWIDDTWPEDEEALKRMIADGAPQSIEELAPIATKWLSMYRRGDHTTEEGQAKEMAAWR